MADRKLLLETLERYFGYRAFRPFQEEIVSDVLSGRDVLAIIATGGGKSLCYQLPALVSGGLTIVVSPLISLMKDQVDDLVARGVSAATLNSSMELWEVRSVEDQLLSGKIRVLYISPERVTQDSFLQFLGRLDVKLIAIDEAHCISMWGHQFRPDYRRLALLKERFPGIPMIALTASAIPEVREDIVNQLKLTAPKRYVGSFNRKNLRYEIREKKDALSQILAYVRKNRGKSGIVYCLQRRTTEEIAEKLRKAGIKALPYHADLSDTIRAATQEKFVKDDVEVICATVAFGMGIDKPDVSYVLHYDMPKNLEAYYQETGRAGRDGEISDCILFYTFADAMKMKSLLEHEYHDYKTRSVVLQKWQAMVDYCDTRLCRRKVLLEYFGEKADASCDGCDNCWSPRDTIDGRAIAGTIVTCVSGLGGRFGASHVADVICGSANKKILDYRHDRNPAYNTGKPYSKPQWIGFIKEMVGLGYLSVTGDKYPVIGVTGKGREIVLMKELRLTKPAGVQVTVGLTGQVTVRPTGQVTVRPTGQVTVRPTPEAADKYDPGLFQELRKLRKSIADANGWPPYVVFHDATLKEMARTYPRTVSEISKVPGVGKAKLEKFGGAFAGTIKEYLDSGSFRQADSLSPA